MTLLTTGDALRCMFLMIVYRRFLGSSDLLDLYVSLWNSIEDKRYDKHYSS